MRHRRLFLFSIFAAGFFNGCDSSTNPPFEASAYHHIRPFWSPSGHRIAFTRTDAAHLGLWSVDSNGSDLRMLHAGDVAGGSWSPNGDWVAFFGAVEQKILARSVTTDSVRVLVDAPSGTRPAWSPDGSTLAFVRNGIVALDLAWGTETLVSPHGSYVQWFPGTNALLVGVATSDASSNAFTLLRLDIDSLDARELVTIRTNDDCGFFVPSPDGTTIFFGRKPFDQRAEVWSVKPALHQVTQLTSDGGDYPAVSPNGQWVVYTRTAPDDGGLWLMRPDGSGKKRLTQP